MNMRQFANRMGVHTSRIPKIEQDELSGSLTVKTLQRAADSLDCVFVYGFMPRSNLEKTVKNQAMIKTETEFARVAHTMELEAQSLSPAAKKELFNNMVQSILESPSTLWDPHKN